MFLHCRFFNCRLRPLSGFSSVLCGHAGPARLPRAVGPSPAIVAGEDAIRPNRARNCLCLTGAAGATGASVSFQMLIQSQTGFIHWDSWGEVAIRPIARTRSPQPVPLCVSQLGQAKRLE